MKKKNYLFLWILLFIFLTTYSFNSSQNTQFTFLPLKKIQIEGANNSDNKKIAETLDQFKGKSIIFVNRYKMNMSINNLQFIKELKIKKIYPDTVRLEIIEYKPIGILTKKNTKILLTSGGEIIRNYNSSKFENLPLVYGDKAEKYFSKFYNSLENINFQINLINQFNHFDINRWDIVLKNGKIVKLPVKNYENSLNKFLSLYEDNSFKKYKIFDFRIKGQLILK